METRFFKIKCGNLLVHLAAMLNLKTGFLMASILLIFMTGACTNRKYQPAQFQSILLSPADYPPSTEPYWITDRDFWLVHTPEGRLMAFAPLSPEYADHIIVNECRYTWSAPQRRFIDPCSGDEWELNGQLNLDHSTELWSNRDLDQYPLRIEGELISVSDALRP